MFLYYCGTIYLRNTKHVHTLLDPLVVEKCVRQQPKPQWKQDVLPPSSWPLGTQEGSLALLDKEASGPQLPPKGSTTSLTGS